jgi:hypothetical protein
VNDSSQDNLPALVIAGGPRNGESLVIDVPGVEKRLGSAADSHLRFAGASVDYHHAGVLWDESAGILLTDQASATGTWVNGERVTAPRALQDGDRISLGPPGAAESVKLLVRIPPQLEAPLVLEAEDDLALGGAGQHFELPSGDDDVFDASGQAPIPAPEAPAPPAPAPAAAATVAPPPPPARIAFKDEAPSPPRTAVFTDQLPAIVVETPRPAAAFPPVVIPSRARTARRSGGKLLPVLAGAAALLLAGGGAFYAIRLVSSPAPALSTVSPARAEPGKPVTLTGTGFSDSAGGNTVRFGDAPGTVTAASDTELTVTVPAALPTAAEVSVTVETRGGRSNALRLPLRSLPRMTSLQPDVAMPGAEVLITGHKLDGKNLTVTVGGVRATVKDARANAVRIEVPRIEGMLEGQGVLVALGAGGEAATPLTLTLGRLPLLTKLEPLRAEAGDRIAVHGRGFDPDPAGNVVTFAGEPGLVVAATESRLDVVVPAVPASGNLFSAPVVVRARGSASTGPFELAVLRPSSGTFLPRFYPAAMLEDPRRVFISSEAGPLFVLSSADDSPSIRERGLRVAAALNALFKAGAAAPAIEVRGGDRPGLYAAGAAQPIVRVTAEDAAGYSQPWNAAMKGRRVGTAALASHWAALLGDYLTLFVLKQRPTRVAEVSSRGKVLLELHAQGERRLGRGEGVPAGLLMPPAPAMAAAMRDLALDVATRGHSVPGAALVGRWTGTMEDVDGGPRAIQVTLRLEGTRLAGSISTRAGKLSMDVPLKAVTYDKGTLSFEVGGGAARRFRGSASGSTLSGSIFDEAQKQTGQFTLQYVE